MSIEITGGSDKQNAWASALAQKQLAIVDLEIERTISRNDDLLGWYLDELRARRKVLVDGFAKIGAKTIIDMHTAGRWNLADALINRARSAKP